MPILVTGATGLVGNNITRLLLERNQEVRVLVRQDSDPRPLEGLSVDVAVGDIRDSDSVRAATQGVTAVVHAAAMIHIGWTGLETQREVNVQGSRNVAVAAREAGARLIYVSSTDALGVGSRDRPANEESPRTGKFPCTYVVTKQEAEQTLREEIGRGTDAVIVNPGLMLGPWDWKPSSGRMLLEVATRFTPLAPTGGITLCDVRDVVEAIHRAIEQAPTGRQYILGGHNMPYREVWNLFAEVSGGSKPWFRAGPLMRVLGGGFGDLYGKLSGREPEVNSASVRMSTQFHYYDSGRAIAELAYEIRPARESVQAAWDWFLEHGYAAKTSKA
jgi:dihydroflavonol-4-reductase